MRWTHSSRLPFSGNVTFWAAVAGRWLMCALCSAKKGKVEMHFPDREFLLSWLHWNASICTTALRPSLLDLLPKK